MPQCDADGSFQFSSPSTMPLGGDVLFEDGGLGAEGVFPAVSCKMGNVRLGHSYTINQVYCDGSVETYVDNNKEYTVDNMSYHITYQAPSRIARKREGTTTVSN